MPNRLCIRDFGIQKSGYIIVQDIYELSEYTWHICDIVLLGVYINNQQKNAQTLILWVCINAIINQEPCLHDN